ncbi:MAG: hypothetical protein H6733_07915 [Alphaproteobacteria bacterium]|nr:hypothetical protein [Alphaproteobacteria bacterium]
MNPTDIPFDDRTFRLDDDDPTTYTGAEMAEVNEDDDDALAAMAALAVGEQVAIGMCDTVTRVS